MGSLKVSLKTDCLGRNTGKEIESTVTDSQGKSTVRKMSEYIYYRKVGDHATQMPLTIRYGDNTGGAYGIRDCLKYAYDEMGNIAKVYENGELSVRYTYDKLGRLVREDNKSAGETSLFDYDNNGNILTKRTLAFTLKGKEEVEELSSTAKEYTYDRDRLLSYNGETFVYDGLGNPTTYRGKTLTWSKGRQLTNYNGTAFAYNGQGQRISKGNISYIYGSDGNLVSQSDGLSFMYDATGVVGIKYGNKYYAFRKDILGNVIGILDENGINIVQYRYDAWGVCKIEKDTSGENLGELNPFRYRGYYYDTETKLYYLKTRYYDPEIGRFITIDDVSYLAPDTINGLNLYAYCNNNPVMNVDPEGTSWWNPFSWNWAKIGVAIGLAFTAVSAIAVSIVTFGAATPLAMTILAGITLTAGILTGINAAATLIEAGIGFNFVRDGIFQGNSTAYNWYAGITEGIAIIGSAVLGLYHQTGQFKAAKKGREFLGKGYKKVGNNRWVSRDGLRQLRWDKMGHGSLAPHFNLETYLTPIVGHGNHYIENLHLFYDLVKFWISTVKL